MAALLFSLVTLWDGFYYSKADNHRIKKRIIILGFMLIFSLDNKSFIKHLLVDAHSIPVKEVELDLGALKAYQ